MNIDNLLIDKSIKQLDFLYSICNDIDFQKKKFKIYLGGFLKKNLFTVSYHCIDYKNLHNPYTDINWE